MGTGKEIQQLALILLFAAILAGCASSNNAGGTSGIDQMIPGATKWGHYNGEPVTKWNPDGRTMTLLTELRYIDPHGEVWVAPVGSLESFHHAGAESVVLLLESLAVSFSSKWDG